MANITLLGVYREKMFSPGKVGADAAILDAAVTRLARRWPSADCIRAEELETFRETPQIVLSMAQSPSALRVLEQWQLKGAVIINSVQSIRNCYRERLIQVLADSAIPIPQSRIVALNDLHQTMRGKTNGGYWLKRGDVHAMRPDDVVKVNSYNDLLKAINHYDRYGIDKVLVQEHVDGRVIKFYGVGNGDYFGAFRADTGGDATDDVDGLGSLACRTAKALDLEVYGGDAIITPDHRWIIIDFNDWPSFSRCCHAAAEAIAGYCLRQIEGGSLELSRYNGS